ncbi:MAG: hypothetical protein K2X81_08215, partial [Candidatus Obscuribacterales bacterium]|nr:hypothetical protein [Candidatus Obscuribacterales bacterium]
LNQNENTEISSRFLKRGQSRLSKAGSSIARILKLSAATWFIYLVSGYHVINNTVFNDDIGNYSAALSQINLAQKLFEPIAPSAFPLQRGSILMHQGNYEKAAKELKLAIAEDAPCAYSYLAKLYCLQHKLDLAQQTCNEAFERSPVGTTYYGHAEYVQGLIDFENGKDSSALNHINVALKTDSDFVRAREARLKIFEKQGDTKKAAAEQKEIRSLNAQRYAMALQDKIAGSILSVICLSFIIAKIAIKLRQLMDSRFRTLRPSASL